MLSQCTTGKLFQNSNRNRTHDVKMAIPTGCLDLAETSVDLGRIYTHFYGADGATAAVWIAVDVKKIQIKKTQKYHLIFFLSLCSPPPPSGRCAPFAAAYDIKAGPSFGLPSSVHPSLTDTRLFFSFCKTRHLLSPFISAITVSPIPSGETPW